LVKASSGDKVPLTANDFSVVDDAFRRGGSHAKGEWNLALTNGMTMKFYGPAPGVGQEGKASRRTA
jgi:hypothetical protein